MLTNTAAEFGRIVRDFGRRSDGQAVVTFALALVPVLVAVGGAVDYTRGSQARTQMQNAIDAAVLAAALDGSSGWQTAATNAFNSYFAKTNGTVPDAPVFTLKNGIYHGSASGTTSTTVMGVVGVNAVGINVKAAATKASVPLCVLGLNSLDSGAFDMNGNAKFKAPDCAVQANTSNGKGMTQEGQPSATARKFGVSGGHTGTNYSSQPQDGAPAVNDPYSNIPFPSYSACDPNDNGLSINGGSVTLNPGTYCGGIRIKGGAYVTLNSGIYVMVGGSFWVDGGSTVTGDKVMIAFTGKDTTLRVWGSSTINLTSPTSGTYANMQFFEDRNDVNGHGAQVSLGGSNGDTSKASWDGVAYFPYQNFWTYGSAVVNANSPSMAIVAGQIWVQGNATVNVTHNNTRNLSVSQTTTSGGARLVQ